MSKTLPLKPRMSEKTYATSVALNTYVFDVPTSANKLQIAAAVEAQFGVSVTAVRTTTLKGKQARSIRIGGAARKLVMGKRADVKKAYVTLKDGDSIPVFAALEEPAKEDKKADKKADKKTKKEAK